eukprot:1138713-Pelagomonas_calceolata.AAC.2
MDLIQDHRSRVNAAQQQQQQQQRQKASMPKLTYFLKLHPLADVAPAYDAERYVPSSLKSLKI